MRHRGLADGRRKQLLRSAAKEVCSAFAEHVLAFDATAAVDYAAIDSPRECTGCAINRSGPGIGGLVYVVIGAFMAGAHDYFEHLSRFRGIASAFLALLLWPLLLLGIDLRIH